MCESIEGEEARAGPGEHDGTAGSIPQSQATPANADGPASAAVDLHGAGRVQRRIWRAFMASPDLELTTAELARWAYPRLVDEPSRKHRWAIVRAACRVAKRVRRDRPGGVVFRAYDDKSDGRAPDKA